MTKTMAAASLLALTLAAADSQAGQAAAPGYPLAPAAGAPVLTDDTPLQCWWRASSGALRLGEVVDLALTCAVLETDAVTAVPDETRLSVAAVQLSPFEIVGGTHPPDVRDGDRRFLQYRYQLRIINPDVVGRDVKLPPLAIAYKLQSRMGAEATLTGRDLVHQMPPLVFRIVSQVPADADDIRDGSDVSLARIDALHFRANALRVAAMVLGALGLAAALSTLAPLVGRRRRARTPAARRLSDRAVLGQAARVLADHLGTGQRTGWTPAMLAAAHQAARIVAAIAMGTGAREQPLAADAPTPDGRLRVPRRFGRQAVAITTHVTAAHLARALAALPPSTSAGTRARLERLREALSALTRAHYGRADALDTATVDEAVGRVRDVAEAMAREQLTSPRDWFRRAPAPVVAAADS